MTDITTGGTAMAYRAIDAFAKRFRTAQNFLAVKLVELFAMAIPLNDLCSLENIVSVSKMYKMRPDV